jgi:hypothetical protein
MRICPFSGRARPSTAYWAFLGPAIESPTLS